MNSRYLVSIVKDIDFFNKDNSTAITNLVTNIPFLNQKLMIFITDQEERIIEAKVEEDFFVILSIFRN